MPNVFDRGLSLAWAMGMFWMDIQRTCTCPYDCLNVYVCTLVVCMMIKTCRSTCMYGVSEWLTCIYTPTHSQAIMSALGGDCTRDFVEVHHGLADWKKISQQLSSFKIGVVRGTRVHLYQHHLRTYAPECLAHCIIYLIPQGMVYAYVSKSHQYMCNIQTSSHIHNTCRYSLFVKTK
jgi:hypothetical protein